MLIKCWRCLALYAQGNWWRVRYAEGTSDAKAWLGKIDDAHCPICRQPPQTEPTPRACGTM